MTRTKAFIYPDPYVRGSTPVFNQTTIAEYLQIAEHNPSNSLMNFNHSVNLVANERYLFALVLIDPDPMGFPSAKLDIQQQLNGEFMDCKSQLNLFRTLSPTTPSPSTSPTPTPTQWQNFSLHDCFSMDSDFSLSTVTAFGVNTAFSPLSSDDFTFFISNSSGHAQIYSSDVAIDITTFSFNQFNFGNFIKVAEVNPSNTSMNLYRTLSLDKDRDYFFALVLLDPQASNAVVNIRKSDGTLVPCWDRAPGRPPIPPPAVIAMEIKVDADCSLLQNASFIAEMEKSAAKAVLDSARDINFPLDRAGFDLTPTCVRESARARKIDETYIIWTVVFNNRIPWVSMAQVQAIAMQVQTAVSSIRVGNQTFAVTVLNTSVVLPTVSPTVAPSYSPSVSPPVPSVSPSVSSTVSPRSPKKGENKKEKDAKKKDKKENKKSKKKNRKEKKAKKIQKKVKKVTDRKAKKDKWLMKKGKAKTDGKKTKSDGKKTKTDGKRKSTKAKANQDTADSANSEKAGLESGAVYVSFGAVAVMAVAMVAVVRYTYKSKSVKFSNLTPQVSMDASSV